jgi:hypothetical protein
MNEETISFSKILDQSIIIILSKIQLISDDIIK